MVAQNPAYRNNNGTVSASECRHTFHSCTPGKLLNVRLILWLGGVHQFDDTALALDRHTLQQADRSDFRPVHVLLHIASP